MRTRTKIFLVDDDPLFLLLTKKIVSNTELGTEVKEFINGQDAIEYIEQNMDNAHLLPDIIFLDLNMPVMDGWGFLNEFQILLPFMKKIPKLYILSSSMAPIDIERANNIPFVKDYLVKPLQKKQLTEIISADELTRFHIVPDVGYPIFGTKNNIPSLRAFKEIRA